VGEALAGGICRRKSPHVKQGIHSQRLNLVMGKPATTNFERPWMVVTIVLLLWTVLVTVLAQSNATRSTEQRKTRVLASGQRRPTRIAIDAQNVYWIGEAGTVIMKVSKDGGTPTVLIRRARTIEDIAVDEKSVYFLAYREDVPVAITYEIVKVDKEGGGKTRLVFTGTPYFPRMTLGEADVYFTESAESVKAGTNIASIAKEGGSPAVLARNVQSVSDLKVDGSSVYWSSYGEDTLNKIDKKAGEPVLLQSANSPTSMFVNETSVYCATSDGLTKVDKNGGPPITLFKGKGILSAVAGDGTSVYFLDDDKLMSISRDGAVANLGKAKASYDTARIAIDQRSIYALDEEAGRVLRIDRVLP
jgi:hypothetical protein